MQVINVSPKFDEATEYSYLFNRNLLQQLEARGYTVLDLGFKDAIRSKVEGALKLYPDALFLFYNHGTETALIGQDEAAVADLDNAELLGSRVTYTLACLSAKVLGVEAFKCNGQYWGYVEVVSFTTDALEAFEEAINTGLILYIDGKTWVEALDIVKQRMTELVDELVDEGNVIAAWCMRNNRDALVCYNGGSLPESQCLFRRLAVKLFGKYGWRIPNLIRCIQKFFKR